ncbi:unnamed protein product [Trichogramma brassicae]|uniref:Uncharacterized protein n=1 Tax=Trichogramma brassicae TaxID=86971 RepID=A0A6H5I1D2_9HYME|nr:unnamed protein product [Trichogramma brassicae]
MVYDIAASATAACASSTTTNEEQHHYTFSGERPRYMYARRKRERERTRHPRIHLCHDVSRDIMRTCVNEARCRCCWCCDIFCALGHRKRTRGLQKCLELTRRAAEHLYVLQRWQILVRSLYILVLCPSSCTGRRI